MAKPVLLTVDDDPAVLGAIERDLRQKYRQDFRTMKTGLLEVRPIFVRKAPRTRAHVLITMLALKVVREMRRARHRTRRDDRARDSAGAVFFAVIRQHVDQIFLVGAVDEVCGAFAVGPISGGMFNPAVATGCLYMGLISAPHYLGYVAAQLAAGALAAFVFKTLNSDDK